MEGAIELHILPNLRKKAAPFNIKHYIENNNFTNDNIHACVKGYLTDPSIDKTKYPIGKWNISKVTDMHDVM